MTAKACGSPSAREPGKACAGADRCPHGSGDGQPVELRLLAQDGGRRARGPGMFVETTRCTASWRLWLGVPVRSHVGPLTALPKRRIGWARRAVLPEGSDVFMERSQTPSPGGRWPIATSMRCHGEACRVTHVESHDFGQLPARAASRWSRDRGASLNRAGQRAAKRSCLGAPRALTRGTGRPVPPEKRDIFVLT